MGIIYNFFIQTIKIILHFLKYFNSNIYKFFNERKDVLKDLDLVCVMSVNPGFGGQKFIPSTLDKLKQARKIIDESGYDIRLEVDGGVGVENIQEIAAAGADTFVAGSAFATECIAPANPGGGWDFTCRQIGKIM